MLQSTLTYLWTRTRVLGLPALACVALLGSVPAVAQLFPDEDVFVEANTKDVNFRGRVTILPGVIVNGGRITGSLVTNHGVLTGKVTLGPGVTVNGGTVSGDLTGDQGAPALFINVAVPASTRLSNVTISNGTVLQSGVVLGAGVRFDDAALITPGVDLTAAFEPRPWPGGGGLQTVDLRGDVLRTPAQGVLADLGAALGGSVTQNGNGELVLRTSESRSVLLPVRVRQAGATPAGSYTDADGNVLLVTASGREVLAYPVVASPGSFFTTSMESRGLSYSYDVLGRFRASAPQSNLLYLGRAADVAVPAFRGTVPGLYAHTVSKPANVTGYSLIFTDENGALMEQDLVPAPADWPALRLAILGIPGVDAATIERGGDISVRFSGIQLKGRTGFVVTRGEPRGGDLALRYAGDLNGDGVGDYEILYPNGYIQALYITR